MCTIRGQAVNKEFVVLTTTAQKRSEIYKLDFTLLITAVKVIFKMKFSQE
jgi:hypothetical protein